MLEVLDVEPGSIGEELELEKGDVLVSINGQPVADLLDVQILAAAEELVLEVRKADGEFWELSLDKDIETPLGLSFAHPEPDQCGNNCLFCFVHQLPPGLRRSLYVKDEDFRFSYLYGAYVTLTNISEAQIERILRQRLSPLYVSVHATDDQLRSRLLGRSAPPLLNLLRRLVAGGIELHTQVVVCPGINDGVELHRTVADLATLHPGVKSLALVPVGLTGYRTRLPQLRPHSQMEAQTIIAALDGWQRDFLSRFGTRLVFAADEFYLQAGIDVPALDAYEELSQLENGVGMIALFRDEAREALEEAATMPGLVVSTVTGTSFHDELARFVEALAARTGATVHLHAVCNDFFGGQVSVTGLLAGRDIIAQLQGKPLGSHLLLPDVLCKEGEALFLDDLTPADLEQALGVPVSIIPATPWGLLEALEALAS